MPVRTWLAIHTLVVHTSVYLSQVLVCTWLAKTCGSLHMRTQGGAGGEGGRGGGGGAGYRDGLEVVPLVHGAGHGLPDQRLHGERRDVAEHRLEARRPPVCARPPCHARARARVVCVRERASGGSRR